MNNKQLQLSLIALLAVATTFTACHGAKEKAKNVISKTGETVGEGASEFVKGVSKGVEQTLECTVEITTALAGKGLKSGKFKIGDTDSAKDNKLTVYLIFDKDFKSTVAVKVFDRNGQEYGRTSLAIEGKSGEAKYYDFVFDNRTDIENKSKFVME